MKRNTSRAVRFYRILPLLFFVLSCKHAALGATWGMYLWDPSHSSFNADETQINRDSLAQLAPIWSFHGDVGFAAAPTVINGIAYVGDWAGNFYALRIFDRSAVWKQFVGVAPDPPDPICQPSIGVSGQAVVANGVVYVPGGDSAIYALDQRTGTIIWRLPLADPASGSYLWSSLTLVNDVLYVGIASLGDCPVVRGGVARIDLAHPANPTYFYTDPDGEVGGGVWSTPAVDTATNSVFATSGNGVYDPASGFYGGIFISLDGSQLSINSYFELPSNSPDDDMDWGSSPTLFQASDGTPLVAATAKDGVIYCLKRSDMSPFWTRQIAAGCDCPECGCGSISTPAYDGQRLYVGAGKPDPNDSNNGSIYAFDPSNGGTLWARILPDTILAPVSVVSNVVFASTLGGLMAFDADTGLPLWNDGARGPIVSQPVVVDGRVFATYANGDLVMYGLPGDNPPPRSHRPVH